MMLDPVLNLAFSIHSSPGVYAVLLGSGVSTSAGIPTGWDITLDLIAKLAATMDEDVGGDPEAWYQNKYGKEPDYSEMLKNLGNKPSERRNLLREYFEPSEQDIENSLKVPSKAHIAIAELVKSGHIRLIITTNFDRLMETALSDVGVQPDVISSSDSLRGAIPLNHSNCTILKLHGDYRDARIKNTEKELSKYSPSINQFLDRALDEFGLIVCGWSATWDKALSSAMFRRKNRRFTTYWALRGDPGIEAKSLIDHTRAVTVPIVGANEFLADLQSKVHILDEQSRPHPLSITTAVATVKQFLSEPKYKIQIGDLFRDETEAIYKYIFSDEFPIDQKPDLESYHKNQAI